MLAQNFKSLADLGLTDTQHAALCKTLELMETGQLTHHTDIDREKYLDQDQAKDATFCGLFNMHNWYIADDCGTVACIAGTAEMVGGLEPFSLINSIPAALDNLFLGMWARKPRIKITVPEAAQALRNYLTYGDPRGLE